MFAYISALRVILNAVCWKLKSYATTRIPNNPPHNMDATDFVLNYHRSY